MSEAINPFGVKNVVVWLNPPKGIYPLRGLSQLIQIFHLTSKGF